MSIKSLRFNGEYSKGIGEYKVGKHWKDQTIYVQGADIAHSITKVLSVSSYIGIFTVSCVPPRVSKILAPTLGISSFLIGTVLILKTIYDLHHIHLVNGSVRKVDQQAPPLGTWTTNQAFITQNGPESMKLKRGLIDKAERSIEISGSYCGGKLFDEVLDQIADKLSKRAQLTVRILSSQSFLISSNYARINRLAEQYPQRFLFIATAQNRIFLPTYRTVENHVKFLVIDGKACMTGGTGIQDVLCREVSDQEADAGSSVRILGCRDMDVVLEGPLAQTMRYEFFKLFAKWSKRCKPSERYGGCSTQASAVTETECYQGTVFSHIEDIDHRVVDCVPSTMLTGSYEHGSEHGCKQGYLDMIHAATDSLVIAHMNVNQPKILQAIREAALRGVQVTLITNATQKTTPIGAQILGQVNAYYFLALLEAGVKIYECKKEGVLYHKKVMLVDKQMTTMGSFNISLHCADTEDEDMVIMHSTKVAELTLATLEEDMRPENSYLAVKKDYQRWWGRSKRFVLSSLILQATAHCFQ